MIHIEKWLLWTPSTKCQLEPIHAERFSMANDCLAISLGFSPQAILMTMEGKAINCIT